MTSNDFHFRIAIATNSGDRIDGHFGSCNSFAIYEFNADAAQLIETRPASQEKGVDKNDYRAAQLSDCHLLYVASIGGPAAAKVIKHGVHPLKDPSERPIADMLGKLQQVLRGTPPPWMSKLMGAPNSLEARLA